MYLYVVICNAHHNHAKDDDDNLRGSSGNESNMQELIACLERANEGWVEDERGWGDGRGRGEVEVEDGRGRGEVEVEDGKGGRGWKWRMEEEGGEVEVEDGKGGEVEVEDGRGGRGGGSGGWKRGGRW